MIRVAVDEAPFEVGAELAALAENGAGGIASFVGVVRGDDGLVALTLEHHPGMTERLLTRMAERASSRWDLLGATAIHRTGRLVPGEPIVFVAAAARHRGAALDACAALIDWLKTEAPFWKHEELAGGVSRWVEPRAGDQDAAARWA
jgi:molybdopterin synthase catalytic subunit